MVESSAQSCRVVPALTISHRALCWILSSVDFKWDFEHYIFIITNNHSTHWSTYLPAYSKKRWGVAYTGRYWKSTRYLYFILICWCEHPFNQDIFIITSSHWYHCSGSCPQVAIASSGIFCPSTELYDTVWHILSDLQILSGTYWVTYRCSHWESPWYRSETRNFSDICILDIVLKLYIKYWAIRYCLMHIRCDLSRPASNEPLI